MPTGSSAHDRRRRWTTRLLVAAAVAAAALLLAQVALPPLATRIVRDRLGGADEVTQMVVHALPAVTLLWGHADDVSARVRNYRADVATLSERLDEMRGVRDVNVTIGRLRAGQLELRDVSLRKRGDTLIGEATLDRDRLDRTLSPTGTAVRLVTPSGVLELETLTGPQRHLLVVVGDGRVFAQPEGLLGSLFSRTIFHDAHAEITGLEFSAGAEGTIGVRAHARFH